MLKKKTRTSTRRTTGSWKVVENTTKGAGKSWKTTWDVWYEPCIPERFCGCDSLLRGTVSSICSFTFTFTAVFVFMFIATCGLTAQLTSVSYRVWTLCLYQALNFTFYLNVVVQVELAYGSRQLRHLASRQDTCRMRRHQVQQATMKPVAWRQPLAPCCTRHQLTAKAVVLDQTAAAAKWTLYLVCQHFQHSILLKTLNEKLWFGSNYVLDRKMIATFFNGLDRHPPSPCKVWRRSYYACQL